MKCSILQVKNSVSFLKNIFCYSRAFGLIPAKHLSKLSEILKIVCDNGFSINDCAMYDLNMQQCNDIMKERGFNIGDHLSSGHCVAFVITGSDAYNRLNQLAAGPSIQTEHRSTNVIYGSGAISDSVFCPSCADDVSKVSS